MDTYPRIYLACHTRHRRDPVTGRELSTHQGTILDHLDTVDGTAAGDLAAHLGVTAGTMSIHLDRLEARGFVRRSRDPGDGRRVLVVLTAAGARVKAAHSVLDAARVRRLLRQLSPAERVRAIEGLDLLARAADLAARAAAPV